MRIPEDLRRTVMFVGFPSKKLGSGGIECQGTAFLVLHEKETYLVTAKHVANALVDNPFLLRINRSDGTADNIHVDEMTGDGPQLRWYEHPSGDSDIAVAPFHYDLKGMGFDTKAVPEDMIVDTQGLRREFVGIGDAAYTVGLFRLAAGTKRNLPVVHTGNIALLPSNDEPLLVDDWEQPDQNHTRLMEGALVQSPSLKGLSGSPVFVRPTIIFDGVTEASGRNHLVRLSRIDLLLLGVWQGAWRTRSVLMTDLGHEMQAPIGFGVVIPAEKIIEVLNRPELVETRAERERARAYDRAAKLD